MFVRMLASDEKKNLIEINLEKHRDLDAVFKTLQIEKILDAISNRVRRRISDEDILFLDEIQATPHALAALRYFYEEKPELPVVAAGSLLELILEDISFSMPVGRIEYRFIGPMNFEEYLIAHQEDWLLEKLKTWRPNDPVDDALHEHGVKNYLEFLLVGGMPEVVAEHAAGNPEWRSIPLQILNTYREDFAKYTQRKALLSILHLMFDRLPRIIGKKIKYSDIAPDVRHAYARDCLHMLRDARVIQLALHSDASGIPLAAETRPEIMKPYWLDVGILNAAKGLEKITLEEANSGPIAEQFIAQHLAYWPGDQVPPQLFYWLRDGKNTNAEVDFLIQTGRSIIPVEIKAGSSGTLRSLLQFLAKSETSPFGIKFCLEKPSWKPISHEVLTPKGRQQVKSHLLSLPPYMIFGLKTLIAELQQNT